MTIKKRPSLKDGLENQLFQYLFTEPLVDDLGILFYPASCGICRISSLCIPSLNLTYLSKCPFKIVEESIYLGHILFKALTNDSIYLFSSAINILWIFKIFEVPSGELPVRTPTGHYYPFIVVDLIFESCSHCSSAAFDQFNISIFKFIDFKG